MRAAFDTLRRFDHPSHHCTWPKTALDVLPREGAACRNNWVPIGDSRPFDIHFLMLEVPEPSTRKKGGVLFLDGRRRMNLPRRTSSPLPSPRKI